MSKLRYCFKEGVTPTEEQQRGLRRYNQLLGEVPPREPDLKEEYYFKVIKTGNELKDFIEEL